MEISDTHLQFIFDQCWTHSGGHFGSKLAKLALYWPQVGTTMGHEGHLAEHALGLRHRPRRSHSALLGPLITRLIEAAVVILRDAARETRRDCGAGAAAANSEVAGWTVVAATLGWWPKIAKT